jgi:phenylacetate-coenzyme A ligase PaaK-like adenylate-forming protein
VLGLRQADRVLSAFDCSFWVSPYVLRAGLDMLGCFHVEAGKIEPGEFYDRARPYHPTVIFGEPSWMIRFSEIARMKGTWPL